VNLDEWGWDAFGGEEERLVEAYLSTPPPNLLHQHASNPFTPEFLVDAHEIYFGHFDILVLMDAIFFGDTCNHRHNLPILLIPYDQTQFIHATLYLVSEQLLGKLLSKLVLVSSVFSAPSFLKAVF
jgi:hypothetical protein